MTDFVSKSRNVLRLICFVFFSITLLSVYGQSDSIYEDTLYKQWASDFIKGDLDAVRLSIESNLKSDSPHPLADYAWVRVSQAIESTSGTVPEIPNDLKEKLRYANDLIQMNDDNLYFQVFDKYSYEQALANNTPYTAYLWARALESVSSDNTIDINIDGLKKHGEVFRLVWSIFSEVDGREKSFDKLQNDLVNGVYDNFPASKAFLKRATKFRPFNSYDNLEAVNLFLEKYPSDPIAMRFKALQLRSLERFDEAADWYDKSFTNDPFYYPDGNIQDKAFCEIKAGNRGQAFKTCEQAAKTYYKGDDEIWTNAIYALQLRRSGDYGAALEIIEPILNQNPESAILNYVMGYVQRDLGRNDASIPYYRKAILLDPKNLDYHEGLIRGLRAAEKYSDVLESIADVKNLIGTLNTTFFNLKYATLEDAEEFEEAQIVKEEAVESFPNSSWMLRSLAWNYDKVGKSKKAEETMLKAIQMDATNNWAFDRYNEYIGKNSTNEEALTKLEELVDIMPWHERVWQKIVARTSGNENKIAVWKRAIEANPDRMMPYGSSNLRSTMNAQKKWDEYLEMVSKVESGIIENGSAEDKLLVKFAKPIIIWQKMFSRQVTKSTLQNVLVQFEDYRASGGRAAATYEYSSDVYNALGDNQKASEFMIKAHELRPDTRNYVIKLVTKFGADNAFGYFYNWMMRNPYRRAYDFADVSVKWGGSPISALNVMYKYDVDKSFTKSKAYESLGNSAKLYEDYYANTSNLGHERYIGWYNSARRKAWEGGTKLDIDYQTNTATIQFRDGTIAKRQDDLLTSKIKRLEVGDTWVSADYNENGSLTKMETSAGQMINLLYNDDNQIESMSSTIGKELQFEYNDLGKPTRIVIKGLGYLIVTYDEFGDLVSTEAFDDGGEQGGSGLALQITQSFQELLAMTKLLSKGHDLSSGSLPDLGIPDENYERLWDVLDEAYSGLEVKDDEKSRLVWIKANLELTKYMLNNTHVRSYYGTDAADIVKEVYQWIKSNQTKKNKAYAIEAVSQFHSLLLKIRKRGVALEYWNDWIEMQEWLQVEKKSETKLTDYRKKIEDLQERSNQKQIQLLETAEWLPKSFLQNDGFWKSFPLSEIIPRAHREGVRFNSLIYRKNGDLVLGTSKGLCVFRKGYWEWFGYNGIRSEWVSELSPTKLKANSDIRALAETEDGILYLGTPEGVLNIKGDYRGKQLGRISASDGLPSSIVTQLSGIENTLLVGTSKGLAMVTDGTVRVLPEFSGTEIRFIHYHPEFVTSDFVQIDSRLIVGTNRGVYIAREKENEPLTNLIFEILTPEIKDDVIMGPDGLIYLLKGEDLSRIQKIIQGDGSVKEYHIDLYGNLITSAAKGVYGLATVPINEDESTTGILTDLGFSLYHNNHFEHFYLPEKQKAKYLATGQNNSFAGFSENEVWVFERDRAVINEGEIRDLLSMDSLGITLLADGGSLKYIRHDDPKVQVNELSYYGDTYTMTKESDSSVIYNNGLTIMRLVLYERNGKIENRKEELFFANQYEPTSGEKYYAGNVKNIVVTMEGVLWVATKMSVFRYQEIAGEEPDIQEFNYFRNSDRFPAMTHMITSITELQDGRIWVVAADEGHLYYRGVSLDGGLLEWNPSKERFERIDTDELDFYWVINSYTPISESEAILGTSGGFALDKYGMVKSYRFGLKDHSYLELHDKYPNLFLGTRGVPLGDLWLFGCGAGVVAYQDGHWFYPDKINQMLPKDLELKGYGSRHTNAIATDPNGKIYVGTDLGLLVYDGGGTDAASFLIKNGRVEEAYKYQSTHKVQRERDALISDLQNNGTTGKLITQLNKNKKETERLEKQFSEGQNASVMKTRKVNADSLSTLISNMEKKHTELLLQLEQADPAIHRLMNIQPIEIASMRDKFKEDECLIQYIPTEDQLFIQMVAKDRLLVREISMGRDSLMKLCRATANYISRELNNDRMLGNLEILYDNLLRPVQEELKDYNKVFVVPTLSMYYVPFGAMVNRVSEREFTYAIEEHNFGYISSTNLLSMLFEGPENKSKSVLLMGDADGSLPAAKDEVKEIAELMSDQITYTGKEVTLENLLKNANNSRIIHLATHGYLNERAPAKSNILLASDKRLSLPEAFNLPLENTEMVVLSACQTAKGASSGLEYATIARAFTSAGASTVLATLWKVNDAATKELMLKFYSYLLEGNNKFNALAKAQRDLINSDDEFLQHPHRWASFIPMGMP